MSRPRDPARYPMYCSQIVFQLQDRPKEKIVLEATDLKDARNCQMTFNAFKRAALETKWDQTHAMPRLTNIVARVEHNEQGEYRVEFLDLNTDPSVARWNKKLGITEDQAFYGCTSDDDNKDEPAYVSPFRSPSKRDS